MTPATATVERRQIDFSKTVLNAMQIMEFRNRHVRGEPLRKLCSEFHIGLATGHKYTRERTQRLRLVATNLLQSEQALATLTTDERVDVTSLLEDMRTMTESLASAGAQSARSARKFATLARESADRITGLDDPKAPEHVGTFNRFQDAAKKAAEVPINIMAATRGNNLPTPPAPLPETLPSDPQEQAKIYEDFVARRIG